MSRPYRVSRHNFTLVEMAIAMAILVVVALIIGTASATFYNGYRRSAKVTEQLKRIRRSTGFRIRISGTIPFRWSDELEESRLVFEGKTDSLHFVTLRRTYGNDRGALLFVRLRVEDGELVAEYSSYPRLPWEDEGKQEYVREVNCEKVRASASSTPRRSMRRSSSRIPGRRMTTRRLRSQSR